MKAMISIRGKRPGGPFIEMKVREDKIASVLPARATPRGRVFGSKEFYMSPGFIDIQVNGFAGTDLNHQAFDGDDLVPLCKALLRTGVTRFCPTFITGSEERLSRNIQQIVQACEKHPLVRSMVLGIHLEGPYIASEDGPRGAHPKQYVTDPDWDQFERLCNLSKGLLKIVTIAPERPGAIEFIRKASKAGLVVAIGHCAPEPAQIDAAVEAGAVLSTHLGNGAHQVLPRHANYLQKQVSTDGLMASMICDGIHLPDYFVKNLIRAKGISRTILVTDAMAAAGASAGRFTLGDLEVEVGEERKVRLPGTPYLAGSALTMDEAVSNCASFAKISLPAAIQTATVNPAKLFKGIRGALEPGERADVVLFSLLKKRIQVEQVFLAGKLEFSLRPTLEEGSHEN
jgi:N-acetylglucosamine-6-phosphate deacetylase